MPKVIILFCFCGLFLACNENTEIAQDKLPLPHSGVRTAKKEKVRMEKVGEILLREDNEVHIGTVKKLRVDENHVFLMDTSLKQILMFSLEGEFIRTLGRRGGGPGEFRYLYTMDVKNNLVACFDQGNFRITLFDTSGVFIRSFGTQRSESVPLGNCVAITQHHTILHCQQPAKLTREQDLAHSYPWLICEFDTLGNVLAHRGEFNPQIVANKIEKKISEFRWSFPQFITSRNSQTYLWFSNIPVVVRYDQTDTVSNVFNVTTPITKPRWVNKNVDEFQHLTSTDRKRLAIQRRIKKKDYSVTTQIYDIGYVDKHSILLILQTEDARPRTHYLSAYDINTGHSLMADLRIPASGRQPTYQRIAVDPAGFVYCIQNDEPDNFVIAKYKIVREEI